MYHVVEITIEHDVYEETDNTLISGVVKYDVEVSFYKFNQYDPDDYPEDPCIERIVVNDFNLDVTTKEDHNVELSYESIRDFISEEEVIEQAREHYDDCED